MKTDYYTRFGLTQALMEETYRGERRLFHDAIQDLIEANNQKLKVRLNGFFYGGNLYGKPTYRESTARLAPSLEGALKEVIGKYATEETTEAKYVKHFFVRSTNATPSGYDLKMLFPSGLHQILVQFQEILVPEQVQSDAWLKARLEESVEIRELIEQKLCLSLLIG